MAFHQFKRPGSDEDFGSFEAFFVTGTDPDEPAFESGWYWWPCFPGCTPDADTASGPFETEQQAVDDAQGDL